MMMTSSVALFPCGSSADVCFFSQIYVLFLGRLIFILIKLMTNAYNGSSLLFVAELCKRLQLLPLIGGVLIFYFTSRKKKFIS